MSRECHRENNGAHVKCNHVFSQHVAVLLGGKHIGGQMREKFHACHESNNR